MYFVLQILDYTHCYIRAQGTPCVALSISACIPNRVCNRPVFIALLLFCLFEQPKVVFTCYSSILSVYGNRKTATFYHLSLSKIQRKK